LAEVPLATDDTGIHVPARSKTGLWAILAAVLLLGLGATWWFTMGPGSNAGNAPAEASTNAGIPSGSADTAGGAAGTGALESGPTPEEVALAQAATKAAAAAEAQAALQAQIDGLVAEKASAMESQLRSQMDSQLGRLRDQLRDAETAADEREKQIQEQKAEAEARQLAEVAARVAAEEEAVRVAAQEEAARIAAEEETARIAAEDEAARLAAAEAAKPKVRRGDLVELGPNTTPPHLVRFPTPRFPEMARRLNRTDVTVPIRVLVDETGKVIEAKLESKKKYGFGFDTEALNVARGATYEPATAEGVPVKMWMTLRVRFK
jgi:TonB family protein